MDDGKKKMIMLGVIVLCLIVAGVVFFGGGDGSGVGTIDASEMTWVKCGNEDCGHSFQMNLKEYFKYVEDNIDPKTLTTPAVKCPKCGEMSCFRAFKCAQCEKVSYYNTVPQTYRDTCPDCGYSQIKEDRMKKN